MLLVGSHALNAYLPINRVLHDWDFWMDEGEYEEFRKKYEEFLVKETPKTSIFDIEGKIFEIKDESKFDPTDRLIFTSALFSKNEVETPLGKARVPDIQTIYDMKKATALCIEEWKHNYDLELIHQHYSDRITQETDLFQQRLIETQERVEESKKNKFSFFSFSY